MEIAYTVGHTQSYDQYLTESGDCKKMGKRAAVGEAEGYEGGSVFRTVAEAQYFLSWTKNDRDYSVYELELPTSWEVDVYNLELRANAPPVYRLLNSAVITRKTTDPDPVPDQVA